jgi:TfoX/Sxy family transcriptional regulator of competence genes
MRFENNSAWDTMQHMDPKVLKEQMERALCECSTDAQITFKPMFGGIMAYCDGKPMASLSDVGLALKLKAAEQDELLAIPGAKRLQYEPSLPPSKQYIVVPDGFLQDPNALAPWLDRSAAFVASLPAKKK